MLSTSESAGKAGLEVSGAVIQATPGVWVVGELLKGVSPAPAHHSSVGCEWCGLGNFWFRDSKAGN